MSQEQSDTIMKQISLGDRMKQYEADFQSKLIGRCVIVRLDGHSFSKFTRFFDQPYDERFHTSMTNTCKDILEKFHDCTLAYTQSDEITLVFPEGLQNFNGRTDKYLSLLAGLTSVRFNHHLSTQPKIESCRIGVATFDARMYQVPDMNECLNSILWRSRTDNTRKSCQLDDFINDGYPDSALFKLCINRHHHSLM